MTDSHTPARGLPCAASLSPLSAFLQTPAGASASEHTPLEPEGTLEILESSFSPEAPRGDVTCLRYTPGNSWTGPLIPCPALLPSRVPKDGAVFSPSASWGAVVRSSGNTVEVNSSVRGGFLIHRLCHAISALSWSDLILIVTSTHRALYYSRM